MFDKGWEVMSTYSYNSQKNVIFEIYREMSYLSTSPADMCTIKVSYFDYLPLVTVYRDCLICLK